jgi:hypothetical protein
MTRILKSKPLPHVVICDTNILWHEDKEPVASPVFELFWSKASAAFDLSLCIPDAVWGELLFQHFTSCHKLLKLTEENIKKISSITAYEHKTRLSPERIRTQIEKKFDKWAKLHRAIILPLPIQKIDWVRMSTDAIWRRPPFAADPKHPDLEKGFRDALIMESVVDFVLSDARKVNIAFLCNDHVLRNATAGRLKTDLRFTAYETLEDFESYLALTNEKFTNEFIAKILARARKRFFSPDDNTCLYTTESLHSKIKKDFRDYFDDPLKSEKGISFPIALGLSSAGAARSTWTPATDGRFWIKNPEFLRIENKKTYFWRSIVTFFRLYTRPPGDALFFSLVQDHERVLILPFHVTWSALVKDDARFHNLGIVDIKLVENEFRAPTADELRRYELKETD